MIWNPTWAQGFNGRQWFQKSSESLAVSTHLVGLKSLIGIIWRKWCLACTYRCKNVHIFTVLEALTCLLSCSSVTQGAEDQHPVKRHSWHVTRVSTQTCQQTPAPPDTVSATAAGRRWTIISTLKLRHSSDHFLIQSLQDLLNLFWSFAQCKNCYLFCVHTRLLKTKYPYVNNDVG